MGYIPISGHLQIVQEESEKEEADRQLRNRRVGTRRVPKRAPRTKTVAMQADSNPKVDELGDKLREAAREVPAVVCKQYVERHPLTRRQTQSGEPMTKTPRMPPFMQQDDVERH